MIRLLLALLLLSAWPAQAESLLTPDVFEALTAGKTVRYSDGQEEQFLPGRRVVLRLSESDACTRGHWYGSGDLICFAYEGDDWQHCWLVHNTTKGIRFRGLLGDESFITRMTDAPLDCPGPYLGS
ncbi:MAG TPA: hypothetical protein DDY29_11565 [Rhodobacteraceae bacterium]|jgi:hypothetical protein|nr:hypothetical protein [Paracoccaceae bacterium]HBG99321.1 hypothetical protein [Paracoccaceae bacterium]